MFQLSRVVGHVRRIPCVRKATCGRTTCTTATVSPLGVCDRRPFSSLVSPTVPVTVLSGFLGAGKTTLVNHILSEQPHGQRIAVLVNDMADINIDADLIRNAAQGDKAGMVELENGCICCTLRDDMVIELATMARQGDIDHIVVESTGVSEPLPVAQTFSTPIAELVADAAAQQKPGQTDDAKRTALLEATEGLEALQDAAHLHSLVTVVDCCTFLEHLHSLQTLTDLKMAAAPGDQRPLAYLLVEQVQFANLILLNKTDLVTQEDCLKVEKLLRLLNPSATVVRTTRSAVDVASLLQERTYDDALFSAMPEWAAELAKDTHTSETEEYGIDHFTLRILGRPFHAERWHALLQNQRLLRGVLRAKGCFWTSVEPHTRMEYSVVGRTGNLIVNTVWAQAGIDAISGDDFRLKGRQAEHEKAGSVAKAIGRLEREAGRLQAANLWHPVTHDRRVELVFIGDAQMDQQGIRKAVEDALLTKEELRAFMASFPSKGGHGSPGPRAAEPNPFLNVPRCVVI